MRVSTRASTGTRLSPSARPADCAGRPPPRQLSPKPWFRSGAGTLKRPVPASVAHLHSETAGLSAEMVAAQNCCKYASGAVIETA
jgi:hypothetical protein